jgi:hypothetical protein
MNKAHNDFVKTINWIEDNLKAELKEGTIENAMQRLIETQSELRKALRDLNHKETFGY